MSGYTDDCLGCKFRELIEILTDKPYNYHELSLKVLFDISQYNFNNEEYMKSDFKDIENKIISCIDTDIILSDIEIMQLKYDFKVNECIRNEAKGIIVKRDFGKYKQLRGDKQNLIQSESSNMMI